MKSEQTGDKVEGGGECVYLIQFDDYDRRPEIFTTQAAALARFEQISTSWNAHLFVKVRSNTRNDPRYNSNAPLPSAGVSVADMQQVLEALERSYIFIRDNVELNRINDASDWRETLRDSSAAFETLRARLAAPAQPLPEGWVAVPRKSTDEMNFRGGEAPDIEWGDADDDAPSKLAAKVYSAMLAAAPTLGTAEGESHG